MENNDYNTGTQLNVANFTSLYPVIYFVLTYQDEQITRDPKQLILEYRITVSIALKQAAELDLKLFPIFKTRSKSRLTK